MLRRGYRWSAGWLGGWLGAALSGALLVGCHSAPPPPAAVVPVAQPAAPATAEDLKRLHDAILDDDEAEVARLLQAGVRPSPLALKDGRVADFAALYEHPLSTAMRAGKPAILRRLLDAGVGQQEGLGAFVLSLPDRPEQAAPVVELLLLHGLDANSELIAGVSLLAGAAQECDLGQLRLLLDKGAAVDRGYRNSPRSTPLLIAAAQQCGSHPERRREMLALLLERGAAIDARDESGATALHRVAALADRDAIDLLLQHGAHLDAEDAQGVSARGYLLQTAAGLPLWSRYGDGAPREVDRLYALTQALHEGRLDALSQLATRRDIAGHAEWLADEQLSIRSFAWLLAYGADASARDADGAPLFLALTSERGHNGNDGDVKLKPRLRTRMLIAAGARAPADIDATWLRSYVDLFSDTQIIPWLRVAGWSAHTRVAGMPLLQVLAAAGRLDPAGRQAWTAPLPAGLRDLRQTQPYAEQWHQRAEALHGIWGSDDDEDLFSFNRDGSFTQRSAAQPEATGRHGRWQATFGGLRLQSTEADAGTTEATSEFVVLSWVDDTLVVAYPLSSAANMPLILHRRAQWPSDAAPPQAEGLAAQAGRSPARPSDVVQQDAGGLPAAEACSRVHTRLVELRGELARTLQVRRELGEISAAEVKAAEQQLDTVTTQLAQGCVSEYAQDAQLRKFVGCMLVGDSVLLAFANCTGQVSNEAVDAESGATASH